MPTTDPYTGRITYNEPDTFTDVLLGGVSVANLQLIQVVQYANGYGYILCKRRADSPADPPTELIDGQTLTHTYYGIIEVIE